MITFLSRNSQQFLNISTNRGYLLNTLSMLYHNISIMTHEVLKQGFKQSILRWVRRVYT